ncbi:hypothetical protein L596_007144 [Steinernema carpocapsae]|uniref:Secreted protein n=1 Tax=Steinernema carpocapsae TaxID=34508 RepID=A0A4U5P938_STECR|nr:hypothetical protein L596_007144 [Steinernema carpocapsae]
MQGSVNGWSGGCRWLWAVCRGYVCVCAKCKVRCELEVQEKANCIVQMHLAEEPFRLFSVIRLVRLKSRLIACQNVSYCARSTRAAAEGAASSANVAAAQN